MNEITTSTKEIAVKVETLHAVANEVMALLNVSFL